MKDFKGKRLLSLAFGRGIRLTNRQRVKLYNIYVFPFLLMGLFLTLFLFNNREHLDVNAILIFTTIAACGLCGILLFRLSGEKRSRHGAENTLQITTERLASIFDARIVGLLYTRFDGVITDANDAFLEMIGYTRSDLGQGLISWVDMTPPEYTAVSQQALEQLKATGFCEPFAKEYWKKDGSRVSVLLGSSLLNKGDKAHIFTYAVNITNLKEAEKREQQLNLKIKHQQEQMFRILSEAPVAIVIRKGPELRVEYANQTALNFTGFHQKEVIGSSADEFHKKLKTGMDTTMLSEVYRTGIAVKGKARPVSYDATGSGAMVEGWFDYVWEPIFDEQGNIDGVATFTFDVSDIVRANRGLESSERRFRFIADAIPHKMWTSGPDGRATYYNKGWSDYLREEDIEKLRIKAWECLHPDELETARAAWQDTIKNGSDMEIEQRFRRYDGVYQWHLTRVCACKDEDGRVSMYVGSSTNIHEHKMAELAVRVSSEKKDEFLGIAAHELRTPITSMKAALQSLERSGRTGVELSRAMPIVNLANKQVNKLAAIVNDLVDVNKIQAGKLLLNKTRFLLSDCIRELVNEFEHQKQKCRFEIETGNEEPVTADKNRVEQVIFNLLSNAVKYSNPGGKVRILVQGIGAAVKCSVTDEGIGIPVDFQPFIFDRFFRVHTSSQTFSGLGLGLFISSEIIKQHGGSMGLESEEGKGSCFWFIIPDISHF